MAYILILFVTVNHIQMHDKPSFPVRFLVNNHPLRGSCSGEVCCVFARFIRDFCEVMGKGELSYLRQELYSFVFLVTPFLNLCWEQSDNFPRLAFLFGVFASGIPCPTAPEACLPIRLLHLRRSAVSQQMQPFLCPIEYFQSKSDWSKVVY